MNSENKPTRRRQVRAWYALILLGGLMVGCIPAREVPPQLSATPAQSYQVTEDTLTTFLYSVTPPDGWRIIAGPAEDPYTFQFINPDDTALIVLSNHDLTPEELPRPSHLNGDDPAQIMRVVSIIERATRSMLSIGIIGLSQDKAALDAIFLQTATSVR